MADDSIVNKNFDPFGTLKQQTGDLKKMDQAMKDTGFEQNKETKKDLCLVMYGQSSWGEGCISGDTMCFGGNMFEFCVKCYSKCQSDFDDWYGCYTTCNSLCNDGCDAGQAYGTEETKNGCDATYGVCTGSCESCESCQGCVECQSFDKAENAQSSLIKNVDESVTRRARGEGYSKAAANMIGASGAQDATANNFNSLAMAQNAAGNSTQADWLTKQGYLDALNKEIENKKKSADLEKAAGFLSGFSF